MKATVPILMALCVAASAEWPYFGAWIGDTSAMKAFP